MLLEGKTILIMGIRNKWSIAWEQQCQLMKMVQR